MNTPEQNDKLQQIATDTFDTIKELIEALHTANDDGDHQAIDDAHDAIYAHALSVEVRSDWTAVSSPMTASEFRILITWGGPAVQIVGQLNDHNEPATATLQSQDWFLPWRDWVSPDDTADAILIEYARCFYFGE
jgi:hypothetical protein